jgi:hypothetical protein
VTASPFEQAAGLIQVVRLEIVCVLAPPKQQSLRLSPRERKPTGEPTSRITDECDSANPSHQLSMIFYCLYITFVIKALYVKVRVLSSTMIRGQVLLIAPCYDFCPVQATAINMVSIAAEPKLHSNSPHTSRSNSVPGSDGRCVQRAGT